MQRDECVSYVICVMIEFTALSYKMARLDLFQSFAYRRGLYINYEMRLRDCFVLGLIAPSDLETRHSGERFEVGHTANKEALKTAKFKGLNMAEYSRKCAETAKKKKLALNEM